MIHREDDSTNDTVSSNSQCAVPADDVADPETFQETFPASQVESLFTRWRNKFLYIFNPNLLGSFNSSIVSNAMINSSYGPRHGSPLLISYQHEWSTRQGPVFDWYHQQKFRTFQTIQYRKERQEPFCHEFIILKLMGGWFCRIERMGDPQARVETLTRSGTTAHDIIQLHPPESFQNLDNDSDVVMETTLPKQVDLLHVLAISYAIKQDDQAKQYTLQRYNCYFFSWTIILVLARRTAGWELIPRYYPWDLMIPELCRALTELSSTHSSRELAFRLTRLLTPNGQVPPDIFIEELRPLITQDEAREAFNQYLRVELWSSGLNRALERAFEPLVYMAARQSARHRHVGQAILEDPHLPHHTQFARDMLAMQSRITEFHPVMHAIARRLPMYIAVHAHRAETRLSTIKRLGAVLKCHTHGAILGAYTGTRSCYMQGRDLYLALKEMEGNEGGGREISNPQKLRVIRRTSRLCIQHIVEHMRTEAIRQEVAHYQVQQLVTYSTSEVDHLVSNLVLGGLLDALEKATNLSDSDGHAKAMIYAFIESRTTTTGVDSTRFRDMDNSSMRDICATWDRSWERWLWESTRETIIRVASQSLALTEPQSIYLAVQSSGDNQNKGKLNNTSLQKQISWRINEHSRRVANNRLGDTSQVNIDIRRAIDTAWMNYVQLEVE
ncbi:hypothetical protein FRC12_012867 [Ceratobasidium sp. 428]|nr:hypothetical protein FRC12_012867 [Ceratobasidium sp. 428]